MRYYVTADVHGYFSELKSALAEKGFFEDKEPRVFFYLIIKLEFKFILEKYNLEVRYGEKNF